VIENSTAVRLRFLDYSPLQVMAAENEEDALEQEEATEVEEQ